MNITEKRARVAEINAQVDMLKDEARKLVREIDDEQQAAAVAEQVAALSPAAKAQVLKAAGIESAEAHGKM